MRELTKHEKATLKNFFDDNIIEANNFFIGKYDAYHGSESFMNGIETALSYVASFISDEYCYDFEKNFFENMIASENEADIRRSEENERNN